MTELGVFVGLDDISPDTLNVYGFASPLRTRTTTYSQRSCGLARSRHHLFGSLLNNILDFDPIEVRRIS